MYFAYFSSLNSDYVRDLASQARLSRTAILEVLRQDFVRTAWAKGASLWIS